MGGSQYHSAAFNSDFGRLKLYLGKPTWNLKMLALENKKKLQGASISGFFWQFSGIFQPLWGNQPLEEEGTCLLTNKWHANKCLIQICDAPVQRCACLHVYLSTIEL